MVAMAASKMATAILKLINCVRHQCRLICKQTASYGITTSNFDSIRYSNKDSGSVRRMETGKPERTSDYCVNQVRRYDYENFLSTLLYPHELRTLGFALRAFNVEIAQVRDMVREATIGEMRMQFWRDAVDKIFSGQPPHHPIALQLAQVLQMRKVSKHWLKRMIECRAERLADRPFSTLQEVEGYSENSVSPIYYILLESIGIKNVHSDHVASHVGKAQGLTNIIRGVPFNAKNSRVYLPNDLMIKHQLAHEDILRGRKEDSLRAVVFDTACHARQHVDKVKSLWRDLPKGSAIIFLPLTATEHYLTALEKVDFNVFHPKLQRRNTWLPLSLFLRKLKS